jgi:succinate dehydrogenase/fumarate reductase flavoprotein subunit
MFAEIVETDVLIIGGGAAGCSAALKAHGLGAKVLMVVKGKMGRSGATPLASAIAGPPPIKGPLRTLAKLKKVYSLLSNVVRLPIPASYEAGLRRMIYNHYGLVDQDYFLNFGFWALEHFYPRLEANGLYVLRHDDGSPALPAAGGNFIVHSHGMTGYLFGESKRKQVLAAGISTLEEATAFSLLEGDDGEVAGAMVYDYRSGKLYAVHAGATIVATGHTNWLSKRATGTREMAANGLAMAARAGAELHNLEIQWYHASDMASPESWMRLHHYPNALTGSSHRARMVNTNGETYMVIEDYSAVSMPYTIQMKKLYEQVRQGNASWESGSFASYSGVESEALKRYQYHWEFYDHLGKDMSRDKLECGITWHMTAGGIKADIRTMATGVRRLYIAGAVGGHMLGSLSFATFDGEIAGASAVQCVKKLSKGRVRAEQITAAEQRLRALLDTAGGSANGISPIQVKKKIREITWQNMMFARTEAGLKAGLAAFARIRSADLPEMRLRQRSLRYNVDLVDALDIEDMLDVLEMAGRASLMRRESRGPHFREDFPFTDNVNWLKQIIISRRNGEIRLRTEPVKQKFIPYKRERIDYLQDPYA